MKKLGYVEEGILKKDEMVEDGTLRDTIITARYDLSGLPTLDVKCSLEEWN